MAADLRKAALFALAMVAASLLALAMTPRHHLADAQVRERLDQIVPTSFGGWQVDRSIVPVPPSPDVQQVLDATYDETLARTYRDRLGRRVMLSLAYGRNQHKGMNTHRPEVCYPAQGFKLELAGRADDATPFVWLSLEPMRRGGPQSANEFVVRARCWPDGTDEVLGVCSPHGPPVVWE